MALRRENSRDDDDRTRRLLDHADASYDGYHDNAFNNVLMDGLVGDMTADVYPPTGHSYPKKG